MSRPDNRTMGDLFREAVGGEDVTELTLPDGDVVQLSVFGSVMIEGLDASQLPAATVESLVARLREAADSRLFDSKHNELIRFGDD